MENKNILVTGARGYLASALINKLEKYNTIIPYEFDVRDTIDESSAPNMILHFACPSDDFEFLDKQKTASTIINGTVNLLEVAKYNNAKFVFASTMGVYRPAIDDIYCTCKLAMENYIKSVYNNYIVLRIPRIYSKCRQKGLMRKIRDYMIPEQDMKKQIEYVTLDDFVSQTLPILTKTNITHEYNITQKRSIREIKQWVEA
jgi:nucleoside-diphosphate-sugar epimerase